MKILHFFLLAFVLVLAAACTKEINDDPCDADNLEDTIVGKWTITGDFFQEGDVEFKADGTLIDENDILLGIVDVSDHKHYVVNSNEDFTATASYDGANLEVGYYVTAFTCDEITLNVFGIEATMTRK